MNDEPKLSSPIAWGVFDQIMSALNHDGGTVTGVAHLMMAADEIARRIDRERAYAENNLHYRTDLINVLASRPSPDEALALYRYMAGPGAELPPADPEWLKRHMPDRVQQEADDAER